MSTTTEMVDSIAQRRAKESQRKVEIINTLYNLAKTNEKNSLSSRARGFSHVKNILWQSASKRGFTQSLEHSRRNISTEISSFILTEDNQGYYSALQESLKIIEKELKVL